METKIVRLTTGEELIAKVDTSKTDVITMNDPYVLVPTRQNAIALAPWLPYTNIKDEGLDIPMDRVVFVTNPHKELVKEYDSAVSGLIVPEKGDVVGVVGSTNLTEG